MVLYLNEYNVAQSVYIFYGDTKVWLDCIAKAQVCLNTYRCRYDFDNYGLERMLQ